MNSNIIDRVNSRGTWQDFNICSSSKSTRTTLPSAYNVATFPVSPEGSWIYDLNTKYVFYSDGLKWIAVCGLGIFLELNVDVTTCAPKAVLEMFPGTQISTLVYPNVDIGLAPRGTGWFAVQTPDGTAAGGNCRGDYAVDLQRVRAAATQVASGNRSFIPGGYNNLASGSDSFVMGNRNTSTGAYNFIATGFSSTSTGTYNFTGAGVATLMVNNYCATILSSSTTFLGGDYSFIGSVNSGASYILGAYSFIGSGVTNSVNGDYSADLTGSRCDVTGDYSIKLTSYGLPQSLVSADHSVYMGTGSTVAGTYNFMVGETSITTGTSSYSFVGGRDLTCTGDYNFVMGDLNTVTGNHNFVNGTSHEVSGSRNMIGGGLNATCTFNDSVSIGCFPINMIDLVDNNRFFIGCTNLVDLGGPQGNDSAITAGTNHSFTGDRSMIGAGDSLYIAGASDSLLVAGFTESMFSADSFGGVASVFGTRSSAFVADVGGGFNQISTLAGANDGADNGAGNGNIIAAVNRSSSIGPANPTTDDTAFADELQARVLVNDNTGGATSRTGFATLVAGTVTVATQNLTATEVIDIYMGTPGGTPGALYISARANGAPGSFTITSTNVLDTSIVAYVIIDRV